MNPYHKIQCFNSLIHENDFIGASQFLRDNPDTFHGKDTATHEIYGAALMGNIPAMKILVEHGIDINTPKPGYPHVPPLYTAASMQETELMRWLIDHGAAVNISIDGSTPYCPSLGLALWWSRHDVAKILIEAGAELNVADHHNFTPLNYVVADKDAQELADLIRSKGGKLANELPGWKPYVEKPPIFNRMELIFGTARPKTWKVDVDGEPIDIYLSWHSERKYGALYTHGLSLRTLNVPEVMDDFRFAELILVLYDWPGDPAEWESPEWRWPIDWLSRLARKTAVDKCWLGDKANIIFEGEPLGPNTDMSAWMVEPGQDPYWPVGTINYVPGTRVVLYTLIALYAEETQWIKNGLAKEIKDKLQRVCIDETLKRDRPCLV